MKVKIKKSENRYLWIDAAKNLVNDPSIKILCPNCGEDYLTVIDVPFDDRDISKGGERIISCLYCKRTEFILIRNTLSNFGKNIDNKNTIK
jgi:hypothetical protein